MVLVTVLVAAAGGMVAGEVAVNTSMGISVGVFVIWRVVSEAVGVSVFAREMGWEKGCLIRIDAARPIKQTPEMSRRPITL